MPVLSALNHFPEDFDRPTQAARRGMRRPADDSDQGNRLRHAGRAGASKLVTLEIDGQAVTVPAGTSIMRAAMELGIKIPKLCATDTLEPFGSCRLCLVEIEGRRARPPPAPRRSSPA